MMKMIPTATKREMEGKGKVVPTEITSKRHLHRCSDPTGRRCSDPATAAPARKDNAAAFGFLTLTSAKIVALTVQLVEREPPEISASETTGSLIRNAVNRRMRKCMAAMRRTAKEQPQRRSHVLSSFPTSITLNFPNTASMAGVCVIDFYGRDVKKWELNVDYRLGYCLEGCCRAIHFQGRENYLNFKAPHTELGFTSQQFDESRRSSSIIDQFVISSSLAYMLLPPNLGFAFGFKGGGNLVLGVQNYESQLWKCLVELGGRDVKKWECNIDSGLEACLSNSCSAVAFQESGKYHCFKVPFKVMDSAYVVYGKSPAERIPTSAWSSSANGLQVHKRRNTYEVVLSPNLEWVGGNSVPLGITSSFSRSLPSPVMEARRDTIIWFLPPILTTNHLLQLFRSAEFGFCFGFKGDGSLAWSMWKPDFGFHEFERGGQLVRAESDCDFQFWKFHYWYWHFLLYEYVQGKPIERHELVYWVHRRDWHSLGLGVVCLPKPNGLMVEAHMGIDTQLFSEDFCRNLFVISCYTLMNGFVRKSNISELTHSSELIADSWLVHELNLHGVVAYVSSDVRTSGLFGSCVIDTMNVGHLLTCTWHIKVDMMKKSYHEMDLSGLMGLNEEVEVKNHMDHIFWKSWLMQSNFNWKVALHRASLLAHFYVLRRAYSSKPNAWIIHAFYLNCYKGWHGTLLQYLFVANYASRYSLLKRTVRDDGLQRQRGQSYVIHLLMLQFKTNVVCCFCLDIGLGTSRISRGREGCRESTDISGNSKALGKLRKECERAKRALSNQSQVRVEIDSFLDGGMDFSEPLTRAKFQKLNMNLFKKTLESVKKTLENGKIERSRIDEIVLVGGSTRIPKLRQLLKDMFNGKEPSKGVNPDEAVAYGAAVLGAKLSGRYSAIHGVTLYDVTPLSLGVDEIGDLSSVVIPKNTPIPAKESWYYHTTEPFQTSMYFQVLQGERAKAKDCLKLGCFTVEGIPPAPRGVATVEVTFEIDADGILNVTGKCNATGKSKSVSISSYKGNLTSEEVERMIREAEQMGEEDKKEKARIDARNRLEEYIYDARSALDDDDTAADGAKVEIALREASDWLYVNVNATKESYEEMMQKLYKILMQQVRMRRWPGMHRRLNAISTYGAVFDCLEDWLDRPDGNRRVMESTVGQEIRDVLAAAEEERVFRHMRVEEWRDYFGRVGMVEMEISRSSFYQAALLLRNFVSGESCTVDRNGKCLVTGWKGTQLHSVSAWKFYRQVPKRPRGKKYTA
ncbi:Heat shock 70 kDa protein BIP1 [Linum perenne]